MDESAGGAVVMENVVRVLVANRPRLLREMILATLSEQTGIDVVGETEDERAVPELVERTRPDFLLIGMEEGRRRPKICDVLLRKYPSLRIIAVAPSSNLGIFYWASFEIHSATLEASEEGLLEVIRRKDALPGGRGT
jgi:AmiR/NasT family two-component response regulator